MKKQSSDTYVAPSISSVLDNLTVNQLSVNQTISNAQKSAQRVEWFTTAIKENRLTDFFKTLESAVNSLPEGTETINTVNPVTGKTGTKKTNVRDIAKRSFSTAFGHAVKGTAYEGKLLKWKLSIPYEEDKAAAKGFEERVTDLLKNTIDNQGLRVILATIKAEQVRHKEHAAQLAHENEARLYRARLLEDIALVSKRNGITQEQVIAKVAMLNDLDESEVLAAIG